MSFDAANATAEEIAARLAKFKRKMKKYPVRDMEHYEKIVCSFPIEMQEQVRAECPLQT